MLSSTSRHLRIRSKIQAFSLLPAIFIFLFWAIGLEEIYYVTYNQVRMDPTFYFPGLTPSFWVIGFPMLICGVGFLFLLFSPWCLSDCICKESYFEMVCWSFLIGFSWMGIGWGFVDAAGLSFYCEHRGLAKGYIMAILSIVDFSVLILLDYVGVDDRTLSKECLEGQCGGIRELHFGKGYCCHYSNDFKWYWIRNYPVNCYGPFPGEMIVIPHQIHEPSRTLIQLL
jgi:hypothetical protein